MAWVRVGVPGNCIYGTNILMRPGEIKHKFSELAVDHNRKFRIAT